MIDSQVVSVDKLFGLLPEEGRAIREMPFDLTKDDFLALVEKIAEESESVAIMSTCFEVGNTKNNNEIADKMSVLYCLLIKEGFLSLLPHAKDGLSAYQIQQFCKIAENVAARAKLAFRKEIGDKINEILKSAKALIQALAGEELDSTSKKEGDETASAAGGDGKWKA